MAPSAPAAPLPAAVLELAAELSALLDTAPTHDVYATPADADRARHLALRLHAALPMADRPDHPSAALLAAIAGPPRPGGGPGPNEPEPGRSGDPAAAEAPTAVTLEALQLRKPPARYGLRRRQ